LLLLLACLSLAAVDVFWGFWDHDAGFYFNQSAMMAGGLRPFVDFTTIYPPLFNALHAVVIAFGADRWTLVWAIPLFWITVNAALTVVYVRGGQVGNSPGPRWMAWVAGATFALFSIDSGGNHITLEHGVVFFGMLSLLAVRAPMPWRFLAIGASVACAALSKQIGILLLLPFLTQLRTWREVASLALGLLTPTLAFLAWLDFDLAAIARSGAVLAQYVGSDSSLGELPRKLVAVYQGDFCQRPWIAIFMTVSWVLTALGVRRLVQRKDHRSAAWLLSWSLVAAIYYGARSQNNFPHYTLNCWPAFMVVFVTCRHAIAADTYRRLLGSGLVLSLTFMAAFSWQLRDIGGKPYFTRWAYGGQLFFLKTVADDLRSVLPDGASVTHLGMEESVLLFLAGLTPRNKDWAPYDLVAPIEGDGILFTDYAQPSAKHWKAKIDRAGYRVRKVWTSPSWGTVYLYWR
jgi:hypothetical protein